MGEKEPGRDDERGATMARGWTRRLVGALGGIWILEALLRAVVDPWPFEGAAGFALDALARAGRLGALGLALGLALQTARWLPDRRAEALERRLAQALEVICRPLHALGAAAIFVAVGVGVATTRSAQMPVIVGFVTATGVVVALGAALGALGIWRGRPAGPSQLGRGIWWSVALAAATLLRYTLAQQPLVAVAALIGIVALAPLPRRLSAAPRAWAALLAGAALLAAAGVAVEVTQPGVRRYVSNATPLSKAGLDLEIWLTDADRDGASSIFGQDCAPLDPEIHPGATDWPDDGIDQNCSRADGSFERALARHAPGGPYHAPPRPADEVAQAPMGVFIVTIDTLRADALNPTWTPELWAWSRGCVRMTRAWSNTAFTDISLFSMFTGTLPRHSLNEFEEGGQGLLAIPAQGDHPGAPPTVAGVLRAQGYATHAIVPLHPWQPFLQEGFERRENPGLNNAQGPDAEAVMAMARSAWERGQAEGRPAMVWAHLMDMHLPYGGHGANRGGYERAARALDGPVARTLAAMPPDALVILTADHGEAFREHGYEVHGFSVFEEEVRVPLVICAPSGRPLGAPREVDTPVSLIDLGPTILDLAGVLPPYPRQGESLVGHLRDGAPLRSPWVFLDLQVKRQRMQGLVQWPWKWVRDLNLGWEALYDLEADPGERVDLLAARPQEAAGIQKIFFEVLDDDLDSYRTWRPFPTPDKRDGP